MKKSLKYVTIDYLHFLFNAGTFLLKKEEYRERELARIFTMSKNSYDVAKKINRLRFMAIFIFAFVFVPNTIFADETITPEQAQEFRTNLIDEARSHLGAPYQFGAVGPDIFDCSGFVRYVAAKACGITLKRSAHLIYGQSRVVRLNNIEAGDLVFFKEGSQTGNNDDMITHVGIYIGNNEFIHSASEGIETGVIISSLDERYWANTYFGAGQILPSSSTGGKFTGNLNPDENVNLASQFKTEPMTKNVFFNNFSAEAIVTANWSFANASPDYYINFRGVSSTLFFSYDINNIAPGVGLMFRYNAGTKAFQLPLIVGITVSPYFRIYGGPMFLFGDNYAPGTEMLLNTDSGVAGIFGIVGRTPPLRIGPLEVRFVQEINYTTYAAKEGSTLTARDLAFAGLEFSSGVSITLPFRIFAK